VSLVFVVIRYNAGGQGEMIFWSENVGLEGKKMQQQ
jgi:hypothetical protein